MAVSVAFRRGRRDHPREYGENGVGFVPLCCGRGIIPANTGKIQCGLACTPRSRDHPREYGENQRKNVEIESYKGPSPRIRGELPPLHWHGCFPRTIPANTGRIWWLLLLLPPLRDHPREYGENRSSTSSWLASFGPSPRIRGESFRIEGGCVRLGTIPANTGRIRWLSILAPWHRDHPREYGENGLQ